MSAGDSLTSLIVSLCSGLFGGVIWSAWWQLYAHPGRGRRNLSYAILSELASDQLHVKSLDAYERLDEPPPDGFDLQTAVFKAVAGRLGELKPQLLGRVAIVYQLAGSTNRLAQEYRRLDGQPDLQKSELIHIYKVRRRKDLIARAFWEQVKALDTQLDEIVPLVATEARRRLRPLGFLYGRR